MRTKVPGAVAQAPTLSGATPNVVPAAEGASGEVLARRHADGVPASSAIAPRSDNQTPGDMFKAKLSAALGCKTSETALALLEQIVALEHTTTQPERATAVLMTAMAQVVELQPCTDCSVKRRTEKGGNLPSIAAGFFRTVDREETGPQRRLDAGGPKPVRVMTTAADGRQQERK